MDARRHSAANISSLTLPCRVGGCRRRFTSWTARELHESKRHSAAVARRPKPTFPADGRKRPASSIGADAKAKRVHFTHSAASSPVNALPPSAPASLPSAAFRQPPTPLLRAATTATASCSAVLFAVDTPQRERSKSTTRDFSFSDRSVDSASVGFNHPVSQ